MYGSQVILTSAVDIDEMGATDLVITFTSGTTDSTGFTRNAHWKLLDGTTVLVDIMIDDGTAYLKGDTGGWANMGSLFAGSDPHCIGTTWDTSSGYLLDFEITIDSSGNIDASVTDHGGGAGANTVTDSSKSISDTTAEPDRLEISWDTARATPPMGIYFGEILITGGRDRRHDLPLPVGSLDRMRITARSRHDDGIALSSGQTGRSPRPSRPVGGFALRRGGCTRRWSCRLRRIGLRRAREDEARCRPI